MKQYYIHYEKWEDYKNGMWNRVPKEEEESLLVKAIEFTSDWNLYGEAMLRVINEWENTCLHNLSDMAINRQAFIGHCAVSLELGIPEYITRMAWHYLSDEQKIKANKKADYAISLWENKIYKREDNGQEEIKF